MRISLRLIWFLDKGFNLEIGDVVSNPVLGEMSIRNNWDRDGAVANKENTVITSFAIREQESGSLPVRNIPDTNLCHPDIDILISLQNMQVVYE